MAQEIVFDIIKIRELLHHRYPFLLIDRVLEFEPGKRVKTLKNVTINEPFFQGHFPDKPIMPGVLQMEAMAQSAALLCAVQDNEAGKGTVIVGADKFKWKKMVVPGDTLIIEVEVIKQRRSFWITEGTIKVDDVVVASGTLSAMEQNLD